MPEKEKNIKLTTTEETLLNQILYYYLELVSQNIMNSAQDVGAFPEDISYWGREVVIVSQILEKIQKRNSPKNTRKKTKTAVNKK